MCAWFVSRALWAGGFPQSHTWTQHARYSYHGAFGTHSVPGTKTAWNVLPLVHYLERNFGAQRIDITSNLRTNAVPQAETGDLIGYDWGVGPHKGDISHLAIIVGLAPGQYPEVSEMSQFEFDWAHSFFNRIRHVRSPYRKRGWTWSQLHHMWLQKRDPHMRAYLIHIPGGLASYGEEAK